MTAPLAGIEVGSKLFLLFVRSGDGGIVEGGKEREVRGGLRSTELPEIIKVAGLCLMGLWSRQGA